MKIALATTITSLLLAPLPATAARERAGAPPTVIATSDTGGLNVLHADFRAAAGWTLPPGLPPVTELSLPANGSFTERVAAARATLGNLERGVLYHAAGTRVLLYAAGHGTYDLFDEPVHGTATASSSVGRTSGTSPDSTLLYIGAPATADDWRWVLEQDWIDLVTTSANRPAQGTPPSTCMEAPYIEELSRQGRVWFMYSGNEPQHTSYTAQGVPAAYRVGGVDDSGRTYYGHYAERDPLSPAGTPTRPYETGDLFRREVASAYSLTGREWRTGTSFAAPATAGRAANLLRFARGLLGSTTNGVRQGALATAARDATLPDRGPLADGDLTGSELVDLLHHVAVPAEPPSPARYFVEGYGALTDEAIERAKLVLRGVEEAPERPEEDSAHALAETLYGGLYPDERC